MESTSLRTLSLTVRPDWEGREVKRLLTGVLHMAEGHIAALKLRPAGICLNGERVFTNARVRKGDILTVQIGDWDGRNDAAPIAVPLDFVYEAIREVVEKINRENGTELLPPVRIDKQIVGFSYDIVNEMLDQIQNAGLLIADLTEENANVYYEAGFAQGLLRAKLGNTAEILYLVSNPKKPDEPFDKAKFDVMHYKMIPYKNDGNGVKKIKEDLEKELKAFYSI